jgi:serine/threonine protein kinase
VLALANNQDPKTLDRFINEIWVLGQLAHPNIVSALDAHGHDRRRDSRPNAEGVTPEIVPGRLPIVVVGIVLTVLAWQKISQLA